MILSKHIRREQGFTLLEALLVLSLVSIILSITVLKLSTLQEKQITEQFIEQFRKDVLFAQEYAMSTKQTVHIIFAASESYYRIRQGAFATTDLVKRTYHPDININLRTMGGTITYLRNGNISKAGTLGLSYKDKESYRLVFLLGRGRFYVEEI